MANPLSPPVARRRGSGPMAWIIAGVAFVVGIGVGAVAVTLLREDTTQLPAASPTTVSVPVTAPAASGAQSAAVTAQVTINDACVRVLNTAQDALQAISELGDAAKQFDVARLDQIVRRLEPIQANLQKDIAACKITTNVPAGAPATTASTR